MKDPGLRKLNLGISFMLSASATAGYCASMINGLLVLPECNNLQFIRTQTKELTRATTQSPDSYPVSAQM